MQHIMKCRTEDGLAAGVAQQPLLFFYNFIRITVVLVTVVAASLEHVILYQIIDRFMAGLGRAGGA